MDRSYKYSNNAAAKKTNIGTPSNQNKYSNNQFPSKNELQKGEPEIGLKTEDLRVKLIGENVTKQADEQEPKISEETDLPQASPQTSSWRESEYSGELRSLLKTYYDICINYKRLLEMFKIILQVHERMLDWLEEIIRVLMTLSPSKRCARG
ncbi:uncharacterized protein LOC135128382 [Zophobas morio]|uniref:uncharacterized protein LOC135128382 n=1 Tax=Zophobas morio TaxID=2755281 RepID=UPI003082F4B4